MMRAEAVEAVRRGLRMAFSRARRPVTPLISGNGAPTMVESGRAMTGPRTKTAPRIRARPTPTRGNDSLVGSAAKAGMTAIPPSASITNPTAARPIELPEVSMATSRNAAIGGTRVARMAGTTAAAPVTATPTIMAVSAALGVTANPALGRSMPPLRRPQKATKASPTPTRKPSKADTRPTTPASTSTEPSTCRRVAPRARSRASSRVRWAIKMPNVFEIMNMPTNKATAAKTNKIVEKNAKADLISLAVSSAAWRPVTTSTFGPRLASVRRATSWLGVMPGTAFTSIVSSRFGSPAKVCACSRVVPMAIKPPEESALPKREVPTNFSFSRPTGAMRTSVSPILNGPASAVARSMIASPIAAGARPLATWYELRSLLSVQDATNVGGPWPPIGSPFLSRRVSVVLVSVGATALTPRTAPTLATRLSGSRARWLPV